jgi:hypothetical protein
MNDGKVKPRADQLSLPGYGLLLHRRWPDSQERKQREAKRHGRLEGCEKRQGEKSETAVITQTGFFGSYFRRKVFVYADADVWSKLSEKREDDRQAQERIPDLA